MFAQKNWEAEARDLLKAELAAKGLNLNDLAKLLTADGNSHSHSAVRTKVQRGRFSAAFLLQCLKVIGSEKM